MFSPIWHSSAVKSLALALVLTFAFSCYIFPSRSPDLFFFFNQISDDSATEQNLFCTAIRNEAERGKVRGLFSLFLILPVRILSCIVEIDSRPQGVG